MEHAPLALHITTVYAAVLALLIVALAMRVALLRRGNRIGLGVGNNKTLAMAKAAHENSVDNIPLALILLGLLELQGGPAWLLHGLGLALLASRLFHAYGMSRNPGHSAGRFYGIIATWTCIVGLAVGNLGLVLSAGAG